MARQSTSTAVRRSDLIQMLRKKHGFSKRKAARAVDLVFSCMASALKCGDEVEIPVGWIQAVSLGERTGKRTLQRFRNIQTREVFFKIARHPQRAIRFRPNPSLIRRGPFPPSPPPRDPAMDRKQEELEQLFSRLMGREITMADLQSLLAASVDPNKPWAAAELLGYLDRLLARLRELVKNRRRSTYTIQELTDYVRQLIWIQ